MSSRPWNGPPTCQPSSQTCQQETPSSTPETNPVPTCQPSSQTSCQPETPSCTSETNPVPTCQPSSQTSCQQGTPSSTPETNPVPPCQPSSQTSCQQETPSSTSETNPVPICQPSSQTSCQKGTPSCTPETNPVPTCQPSSQTSCQQETPSCTPETNPVPHSTGRGPAVCSITQVLFKLLMAMKTCFQGFRELCMMMILYQHNSLPDKVFLPTSSFKQGLHFYQELTSCIGFCVFYLSLILLIRAGDIETNPGPESTISDMEFLKLAQAIPPSSYSVVGISLEVPFTQTQAILAQHLNNYTNALQDIFMKWNIKQLPGTNKREVLADKLLEIDLGDLSNRLRNGSPIPNKTGALSRPQTQPLEAESQTKHLSPELIERCAKEIKSKYRSTLCKIRSNPLDPASRVQFEDMYTNLVLHKEDGRCKQLLDYNDILGLRVNEEFPNRIMVQGEAGAGKTTLCAKIAWDWAQEKSFSHFTWVLIVPLRDSKKYTIGEIAKSYLTKNNPATVSQITEFIRTNQDRVFIAFDGLDEFSGKVTKQGIHVDCSQTESYQSQSTDQAQATNNPQSAQARWESTEASRHSEIGGIQLTDILSSDELDSCPVIVTSRPWKAIEIRSDDKLSELYTCIHVEGFNKENVSVYIHKYFPNDADRANQLNQFTKENDVISENMAHYPIYVAMLCLMWKELSEQKLKEIKSLKTFSQIFQKMIVFLKEHYSQKMIKKVGGRELIAKRKEINHLLEPVTKLAFTGLQKNTLVFSEDDFQMCRESLETACRVGILSQEDRITSVLDMQDNNDTLVHLPVFFPHKLFQEYMAGIYLASLYKSDHHEFNRVMEKVVFPRKEEFRYLLYFTVSQNKPIANHVMTCMVHQGNQREAKERDFFVDVAFESRGNQREAKERDAKERDFFVDVAFESQDPEVADLVRDSVSAQELRIERNTPAHTVAGYAFTRPVVDTLEIQRECGPTVSVDLAEMICSIPSLKEARLEYSSFHSDFFTTLAEKGRGSKVQKLMLFKVTCQTPAAYHNLAGALCVMPHLNDLILFMGLNEEFCSSLRSNASSLQVKSLSLIHITCETPAAYHHLAGALCVMPHLTDLTLFMDLNEEFCSSLRSNASSLQGSFPEIKNGNFTFNYKPIRDLNELLCRLSPLRSMASHAPSPNHQSGVSSTCKPWSSQSHRTPPYQPSMDPLPNPQSRVGSTSVPWSSQSHSTPPYQPYMDPSPNPQNKSCCFKCTLV